MVKYVSINAGRGVGNPCLVAQADITAADPERLS